MKTNLRQPGATIRMSDRWVDHRARGSLGGTDFVDGYGTEVHAALDGAYVSIVDNSPDGSGGRVCRVTGPDGDSVERLHHHAVTASRGQRVNAEDVVGISGASAYGSNYGTGGPHIHEHGIHANGVRFNLEPYYWFLNGGTSPASGGNATPIQEDDMYDQAARDEVIGRIDNNIRPEIAALGKAIPPDRREFAVVESGGGVWICDFAAGKRYNAARGQDNVPAAFRYVDWLRDGLGWPVLGRQAGWTIAGLIDTTEEGTVRQEVSEGIRDVVVKLDAQGIRVDELDDDAQLGDLAESVR